MSSFSIALSVLVTLFAASAYAADPTPTPSTSSGDEACAETEQTPVITQHVAQISGKSVAYSATVGFLKIALNGSTPPAKGCIFYTYYQLTQPQPTPTTRPLLVAFNGGPGSASLWLHIGALGPMRVNMGTDGVHPPLPFQLQNNDDSPLDLTDMVIIDPVGTGFSHALNGSTNDQFYGAKNDANSVQIFIRDFVDQYSRRSSPLYLMGESYGGIRASLVAQALQTNYYMPVKGVILVSPYLSSTTTNFGEGDNDVPYVTYFPSYATTAWYQKRLAPKYLSMDVDAIYELAKSFAWGEYRDALALGNDLSKTDYHAISQKMSDLVGISQTQIEQWDLRIQDTEFFSGLLYDQREEVGRYDSRYVRPRLVGQVGTAATDPSDSGTAYPFVDAINSYLRDNLNFNLPMPYVDQADTSNWPLNSDGTEFGVMSNLSQALADNPALQIFVANGYYDLACPMGTAEYERERLDPSVDPSHMIMHRYSSGHMVYINPVAFHQMKQDLTQFFAN